MDFHLSDAQKALRAKARGFAQSVLKDVRPAIAGLATPQARFEATRPAYEELVKQGFMRGLVPVPFGGEGTGMLDMAVVAEEFHAVDVNVSLTMLGNLLGLTPLFVAGSDSQRKRWLAPFLTGTGAPLAALANSEPGGSANSEAASPGEGTRTTAELVEGQWRIRGRKQWISSATGWTGRGADFLAVVCRTGTNASGAPTISVIGVDGPTDGIVMERASDSMGHRGHLTPRFQLNNVTVPEGNLIGPMGGGREVVVASFTGTAALVGVFATAVLRAAFAFALEFARTERRGGVDPIIEHQAVGYGLADVKGRLEAIRALSWRACWAADANIKGAAELALHSKVFCSETAVSAIIDLMRIVGVDSYDYDLPLAGLLQDAIAFPLFDGGNMGVRRRQLHALLRGQDYSALDTVP